MLFADFIVGVSIQAYLAIGMTKVVYIASLGLSLPAGRSRVIWDCTSCPNFRYPNTVAAAAAA